jgi:hypothetical protein
MLSTGMLLVIPQGQMGYVPNLGFLAFMGGIALAAVNQKVNQKYTDENQSFFP